MDARPQRQNGVLPNVGCLLTGAASSAGLTGWATVIMLPLTS
jgi:hypothetical protein